MNGKVKRSGWLMTLAGGILLAALVFGCSTLKSKENSGAGGASTRPANTPVYYDFGDVLLPRELKVDQSDSFVMNAGGVTSGVLALRGNVDSSSLAKFFESKMPEDGWRKKGSFSSARSIMLFEKKNRWCVITIMEGKFTTDVEIWVAPTESGI